MRAFCSVAQRSRTAARAPARDGAAVGTRRTTKRPEELAPPAQDATRNPVISRKVVRRKCSRALRPTLEAIADRDLLDVAQVGVLGLRNAAPIHREPLELDADAVGDVLDLAERIRVVADPAGHLIGVAQLET